jgi:hypothetical protein
VVGFFRSNTRKEFAPVVEDVGLMSTHFAKPAMVLLLVHSTPDGRLKGGFATWEQRVMRMETPRPDFPFDRDALRAGPYEICGSTGKAAAGRQAAAAGTLWPAGVMATYRAKWSQAGIDAVAETAKMLAPLRFPMRSPSGWLVAGTALATAVFGGIVYRDNRPNETPHRTTTEIREADRWQSPPLPVSTVPVQVPPRPAVNPVLVVPDTIPVSAVPPTKKVRPTQPASRKALVHFAAIAPKAAPEPPLPAAPDVALALPPSPEPLPGLREILPSGMPMVRDPFVRVTVDPVTNGHRSAIGRLFSGRKQPEGAFVPPGLLQEPRLEVPIAVRTRIRDTVPVTVKLYLDRTGRVQYAELLSNGTGANRDVASLAIFASRKWQFSPARQEGKAVPAEVLVRFRFGASADR